MRKIAFSTLATAALATFIATGNVEASTETYTVKPGDSLWKISSQHKVTVDELKKINGLVSDTILIDQKLTIATQSINLPVVEKAPSSKSTPTYQQSKPVTRTTPSTSTYIVKAGDSLWKIASQHNLTIADLKNINNLVSDTIYVNQKISVSSSAPTKTKPTATVKPDRQVNNPSTVAPPEKSNHTEGFSTPTKNVQRTATDLSRSLVGTPYAWGGVTTAGFDCSGFIHYVFNAAGLDTPRTDTIGLYSRSYYVDKPVPGDLVFFENTYRSGISHAGIYIGEGKFIHAGTKQVEIASLDSVYWKDKFDGFKRFYSLD